MMAAPTSEDAYDHLATKADVERVRVEVERVRAETERLRADVSRWMFQLGVAMISAVGVIVTAAVAFLKLTG